MVWTCAGRASKSEVASHSSFEELALILKPRNFLFFLPHRRLPAVAALLLAAASISFWGQQAPVAQPPALPAPRAGYSFPAKQTFTYAVDWRVFPAATAVLHLEADGTREHLTANADTLGAINLLFHVSDKFQSTA